MRIFQLKLLPLMALLALGACNGGEDFGDSIPGPIQEGPGSAFDPTNRCSARITGVFVHAGAVRNLGYHCDGFYGRTGLVGIESEQEENYFVCPRSAKSVEFFVGGRTQRLSFGSAYFRPSPPSDEQCSETKYDANGPYLFTVADLFDPPARVDVLGAAPASTEYRHSRNIAALLHGLDVDDAGSLVLIDDVAHEVIFDPPGSYVPPDEPILDLDYDAFVAADGAAQGFLDQIVGEGGETGSLPARSVAEDELDRAMKGTAAGVYKLPPALDAYGLIRFGGLGLPDSSCEECVPEDVVLGGGLYRDFGTTLAKAETRDPVTDYILAGNAQTGGNRVEYLPTLYVDRQGRVRFAGAFETVGLEPVANDLVYHCDRAGVEGRAPVYMTVDAGASLLPDLRLNNFFLQGVDPMETGHSVTLVGRFIDGQAYNGVTSQYGKGDYAFFYPDLPSTAHQFDETVDKTMFTERNVCVSRPAESQPVLALARAGAVAPVLDEEIMQHHFGTPQRYILLYLSRATADSEDFEQEDALRITIHSDGSVYSDLNQDGNNGSVDAEGVPSGEYVLGFVSSVYPGEEEASRVTGATVNLILHNLGTAELLSDPEFAPFFGVYFRARLVPGSAGEECENRLFSASAALADEVSAPWFNPYAVARQYRTAGSLTHIDKYEILKQYAYGFVEAERADCVPGAEDTHDHNH